MIPAVPLGLDASLKVTEQQVLDWIAADPARPAPLFAGCAGGGCTLR
jgi:hypothetical protein